MAEEPSGQGEAGTGWQFPDAENAPSASEMLVVDVAGFEGLFEH